jgi:hypothetical protein
MASATHTVVPNTEFNRPTVISLVCLLKQSPGTPQPESDFIFILWSMVRLSGRPQVGAKFKIFFLNLNENFGRPDRTKMKNLPPFDRDSE